jgi:hypothetical protein
MAINVISPSTVPMSVVGGIQKTARLDVGRRLGVENGVERLSAVLMRVVSVIEGMKWCVVLRRGNTSMVGVRTLWVILTNGVGTTKKTIDSMSRCQSGSIYERPIAPIERRTARQRPPASPQSVWQVRLPFHGFHESLSPWLPNP